MPSRLQKVVSQEWWESVSSEILCGSKAGSLVVEAPGLEIRGTSYETNRIPEDSTDSFVAFTGSSWQGSVPRDQKIIEICKIQKHAHYALFPERIDLSSTWR